jgi:hypothetical protein
LLYIAVVTHTVTRLSYFFRRGMGGSLTRLKPGGR